MGCSSSLPFGLSKRGINTLLATKSLNENHIINNNGTAPHIQLMPEPFGVQNLVLKCSPGPVYLPLQSLNSLWRENAKCKTNWCFQRGCPENPFKVREGLLTAGGRTCWELQDGGGDAPPNTVSPTPPPQGAWGGSCLLKRNQTAKAVTAI